MANNLYSELDSVNDMLESINEQPASTFENTEFAFALQAREKLRRVSIRLQKDGWKFNRVTDQTINLTTGGELPVPTDTLLLEAYEANTVAFDWRGSIIFNPCTNDTIFTESPRFTITSFLVWDHLPMWFREYVTAVSVREFEADNAGNPAKKPDIVDRESRARAEAARQNVKAHNINILNTDPAYDIARRQPSSSSRIGF